MSSSMSSMCSLLTFCDYPHQHLLKAVMQNFPARKTLAGRSLSADVDKYPDGRRNYLCKIGGVIEEEGSGSSSSSQGLSVLHIPTVTKGKQNGLAKFPKLEDCTHFHYDTVEIGALQVSLYEGSVIVEDRQQSQHSTSQTNIHLQVKTARDHTSWIIEKNIDSLCQLDRQLHLCVFDRKYSMLPHLGDNLMASSNIATNKVLHKDDVRRIISAYFKRLSTIAGNMVNCAAILNWFETDNRGHRVIIASDSSSAINIPAVGAALVIKRYTAQVPDEISLEVGEIISLIDMPPLNECNWWRGKRLFEVGFFPADCVESIAGKVPEAVVAKVSQTLVKPVLRKRGKLIVRLRAFFTSRPARNQLKHSGIVKERVFGCDLGELLMNSGHDVPSVLKFCTEVIETHGVVDGIYRLSGIASNIQKLRREFDDDRVPTLTEDIYVRDIHSISSLLKMYFRELPNPLLTYQLYDKFVAAIQDEENKLVQIHNVIQQLPPPHYRTCAYLMKHLNLMASFGKKTCMTGRNLAIVWAPNLLRCKELEQMQCNITALKSVGTQAVITEFLINYADLLFNENLTSSVIGRRNNSCRRQLRPKSLAISTPTKLLSLEEARQRALVASNEISDQVFLDVGGGPAALPPVYHTVIDVSKRGHSAQRKKSPSSISLWKDFLGHKPTASNKDSAKRSPTTEGISATISQSSFSILDKSSKEVAMSKGTQKSEHGATSMTKKDSRRSVVSHDHSTPPIDSYARQLHSRGMTSQSIHSSTPYSTPPIDSCSLEDVTLCGQQPDLFAPSVLVSALSNSFRRSQSIGFDSLEASVHRKSVTFSESTYSSASGTGVSRARRASTALPEESLSSSASSDDVFMSAAGSRECSTSPCDAQPRLKGSNAAKLLTKVTREMNGLPVVNCAKEEQNTEVGSDVYYSILGSDSESEPFRDGNRLTLSNGSHCIGNLCSDEDENVICYNVQSDKRFHSPVGYYSSKSRRSLRTSEDEARSASVFRMNHSEYSNMSTDSDNSHIALGDNTRCCDTDCDTGLEYRPSKRSDRDRDTGLKYRLSKKGSRERNTDTGLQYLPIKNSDCDHDTGSELRPSERGDPDTGLNYRPSERGSADRDTATTMFAENIDQIARPCETVKMSTETGEPDLCTNPQSIKYGDVCGKKCVILGGVPQSPIQKSRRSSGLPHGDTWKDQSDLLGAVSVNDCQKKWNSGPVERRKGFEEGCEEWRFIDDTDDDVFCNQPPADISQQNHKVVAQSKLTLHGVVNSSVNAEGLYGSPFLSPPNSPTLLQAVTDVWMKEFGAIKEKSVEADRTSKTRRVDSATVKCQQQTKLITDIIHSQVESHYITQRSRSSGSLYSHRPTEDQVKNDCHLPSLVVSVDDKYGVCQPNVSNNSNKNPEISSSLNSDEVFESVHNDLVVVNHKENKTTAGTTCQNAENFSHNSSFQCNAISSVPDVIRDATNSCGTGGVSLRKKSVKELKSRFEQNIANELLEMSKAPQSRKMPPPRYSRSQSYHGFQTSEANDVASPDCNDRYGLSKFGRSVGVLTVDVVQCTNEIRNEVVSSEVHIFCTEMQQVETSTTESVSKSVEDELKFMTRYAVPSVSARISCFEPLLSTSRLSPEFRTTPENKRARLSSCGSSVANNANRRNVTVIDNNIMFVNSIGEMCSVPTNCMKTELEDHCRPQSSRCDLLSLLDIPPVTAIALPKVSERKRLFEAESSKSLNSQSPGVRCSSSSYNEDAEYNQKSPSSKEDKENSCVLGRSHSRRKLFDRFEPGNDASLELPEKSDSDFVAKCKPTNVNDSMESSFTGATASQPQALKWSSTQVLPT